MDNGFPEQSAVYVSSSANLDFDSAAKSAFSSVPKKSLRFRALRPAAVPQQAAKRIIDIVGSTVLIVALSPLLAVIGLIVRRTGRNVIFTQQRVGRNGTLFTCYKFRTMHPDAEQLLSALLADRPELKAEWVNTQKLRQDPRITEIGNFLRKTSLDELPQLFNVWKGDMSLVGPRPVVQNEILRYGRSARWYLSTRPGMTGLWQVSGRSDTDYSRRVAMDSYYVRKQNLLLDCAILLRTVKVVLRGDGSY